MDMSPNIPCSTKIIQKKKGSTKNHSQYLYSFEHKKPFYHGHKCVPIHRYIESII